MDSALETISGQASKLRHQIVSGISVDIKTIKLIVVQVSDGIDCIFTRLNLSHKGALANPNTQANLVSCVQNIHKLLNDIKDLKGAFGGQYKNSNKLRKLCKSLQLKIQNCQVNFGLQFDLGGEISVSGTTGADISIQDKVQMQQVGTTTSITQPTLIMGTTMTGEQRPQVVSNTTIIQGKPLIL